MVGTLIGYGAKLRPPMPELRLESPGPAPFDGAQWAAGRWEWNAIRTEWQWRGGGWRDSTRFGHTGGDAVVVSRTVVVEPAPTIVVEPPTVTTVVSTPVVVTPPVVIEVGRPGYQPRPTYQRPARPYQPRPSTQRPQRQEPPATRRPLPAKATQVDDDKRRR